MAKPVFAEMFIPAVGIIMLVEWMMRIVRKDESAVGYFRQCLAMLLCSIPALMYILAQFLAFFGGGEQESSLLIFTKWMEVWSMYSENIVLSIILGMAFPVFMILIDGRFFANMKQNSFYLLLF